MDSTVEQTRRRSDGNGAPFRKVRIGAPRRGHSLRPNRLRMKDGQSGLQLMLLTLGGSKRKAADRDRLKPEAPWPIRPSVGVHLAKVTFRQKLEGGRRRPGGATRIASRRTLATRHPSGTRTDPSCRDHQWSGGQWSIRRSEPAGRQKPQVSDAVDR